MFIDPANRQYHHNNLRILYGGFPPEWSAGKFERKVLLKIGQHYANKFPDKQIQVVSPNWDGVEFVKEYAQQHPSDILVVCSLCDPIWFKPYSDELKIQEAGYTTTGLSVDFFAIVCRERFQQYSDQELTPTKLKYLFLSYNRKPHDHRIALVQELERQQLTNVGLITLGDSKYTLNESADDYAHSGGADVFGDVGIPHDAYSLGRLDVWKESFINIVSETVFPWWPGVFVSEKTFKPIIGMRPFIINGGGAIYPWLRKAGFDCFEDLFPVDQLIDRPNDAPAIIANAIAQYKDADLDALYQELLPRLNSNRARFFEYAQNELNKL